MVFIVILLTTTLSIAGSAAFFSIYGLAQIFTGSFWPVVVMASSLEAGKLVAASYVYRYWSKITFVLKVYLISAILILMVITSAGIFGFLSSAYQKDILPIKLKEQKVELLLEEKKEVETLKQERLERRRQIDIDIASLPNNFVTGRQRLMKSYGPELDQIRTDIAQYTNRIREITLEVAETRNTVLEEKVHTGPIVFIAKVFDQDVDDTTKWLVILIMFAFDPLAVILTVGANIAILERSNTREIKVVTDPKFNLGPPDADEPNPSITSVDQLFEQPTTEITATQIREALEEFRKQEGELTPNELAQKGMLEEMLRKKEVTERIRKGR